MVALALKKIVNKLKIPTGIFIPVRASEYECCYKSSCKVTKRAQKTDASQHRVMRSQKQSTILTGTRL